MSPWGTSHDDSIEGNLLKWVASGAKEEPRDSKSRKHLTNLLYSRVFVCVAQTGIHWLLLVLSSV